MVKLSEKAKKAFMPTTVRVMIATQDGELLFLKRSKEKSHGGKWDVAGGGVEKGESYDEAAWRETFEETGITPKHLARLGEIEIDDKRMVLYIGMIKDRVKPELDGEHNEYKWKKGIDKRPDDMHPRTKALIESELRRIKNIVDALDEGKKVKKMDLDLVA